MTHVASNPSATLCSLAERRSRQPRIGSALTGLMLGLLICAGPAFASAAQSPGRVVLLTRPMVEFYHREQALAQALEAGQSKAAEGLLTPNFEVRTAANPGMPMPRAQWIQWMLHNRPMGTRIDGMAVHDYGTVAVVSFHQHDVLGAAHVANDRFVVDVWVKQANNWLLSVRYSSAGAPSHRLQGAERKG